MMKEDKRTIVTDRRREILAAARIRSLEVRRTNKKIRECASKVKKTQKRSDFLEAFAKFIELTMPETLGDIRETLRIT